MNIMYELFYSLTFNFRIITSFDYCLMNYCTKERFLAITAKVSLRPEGEQ